MKNIQEYLSSMQKHCIALHLDIMIEKAGKRFKNVRKCRKTLEMLENYKSMLADAGKH